MLLWELPTQTASTAVSSRKPQRIRACVTVSSPRAEEDEMCLRMLLTSYPRGWWVCAGLLGAAGTWPPLHRELPGCCSSCWGSGSSRTAGWAGPSCGTAACSCGIQLEGQRDSTGKCTRHAGNQFCSPKGLFLSHTTYYLFWAFCKVRVSEFHCCTWYGSLIESLSIKWQLQSR